ncbi:MAG TPA: hypothetical protein PLB25_20790 [Rhodoferax sp.]|nr:hypothetical protein [Rhodoferax sp.]
MSVNGTSGYLFGLLDHFWQRHELHIEKASKNYALEAFGLSDGADDRNRQNAVTR